MNRDLDRQIAALPRARNAREARRKAETIARLYRKRRKPKPVWDAPF